MISIENFHRQFIDRHDFNCSDCNVLANRFSYVSFRNIPEAWIIVIDKFLSLMNQPTKIHSISQVYGFLVVESCNLSSFDKHLLEDLEEHIKVIDIDLHEQIEEGIILH